MDGSRKRSTIFERLESATRFPIDVIQQTVSQKMSKNFLISQLSFLNIKCVEEFVHTTHR